MRWWLFISSTIFCIDTSTAGQQRWKGEDKKYLSSQCDKYYQPATITQCITQCKRQSCNAFSIQKRIQKCCLAIDSSGTSTVTSSDPWDISYSPVKTVNEARTPAVQTPGTPPSFCPVIFRDDWQKFYKNVTSGKWSLSQSSFASSLDDMFDDDLTTTGGTGSAVNAWILIDFKKPFRLTSLWITAGATPIQQLDVRIGDSKISGTSYFTSNTRCNSFKKQTLTENEKIYLTCSNPRGVKGQYLSIQQIAPTANPLEIAELQLQGFARVCDSTTDF